MAPVYSPCTQISVLPTTWCPKTKHETLFSEERLCVCAGMGPICSCFLTKFQIIKMTKIPISDQGQAISVNFSESRFYLKCLKAKTMVAFSKITMLNETDETFRKHKKKAKRLF